MRSLLRVSTLPLLLALAACSGGSGAGNPSPDSGPRVRIENRSSVDMDIFVRPSLDRATRLGFVPASDTASFSLPRAYTAGSPAFNLEARPRLGQGRPVSSEPFNNGGDEIFWSIPPQ